MKPIKRNRSKEVTVQDITTGVERTFKSVAEASDFIGYSRGYTSGLISGKRKNRTKYIFSADYYA